MGRCADARVVGATMSQKVSPGHEDRLVDHESAVTGRENAEETAHAKSIRSLGSSGSAVLEILLRERGLEIDLADVGEGGEPGENVGEFLAEIHLVSVSSLSMPQSLGELSDLFGEPQEGSRDPSLGIGLVVTISDVLLELGESHDVLPIGLGRGFLVGPKARTTAFTLWMNRRFQTLQRCSA